MFTGVTAILLIFVTRVNNSVPDQIRIFSYPVHFSASLHSRLFALMLFSKLSSLGSCIRGGLSSRGQMSRPRSQTDPPSSAAGAAVVFGRTSQSLDPVPVRWRLAGGGLKELGLARVRRGLLKLSSTLLCVLTRGPAVGDGPDAVVAGPAQ